LNKRIYGDIKAVSNREEGIACSDSIEESAWAFSRAGRYRDTNLLTDLQIIGVYPRIGIYNRLYGSVEP
jgi:hypothetical protein